MNPLTALIEAIERERDRWALWAPVLLGTGIALYFALPAEPHALGTLAPLAVALAIAVVWRRGGLAPIVTGLLVWVSLGLALGKLRTEWVAAPVLERRVTNVAVEGFVEAVEPRLARGPRITLAVTRLGERTPTATPRRVRISLRRDIENLGPGDYVRVKATLAPPSAPSLPGDYDFARQAYFRELGGVGYAIAAPERVTPDRPAPLAIALAAVVQSVRRSIAQRIAAALPDTRGAIATALITGERSAIPEAVNDAYRDAGLFHVLSISGLHMAIMGGAVFFTVRGLLALFPAIALRFPIKKWAALAALVGSLGYLAISGMTFATIRSFIMISIMLGAILIDRPAIALRNVALSALAILLMFPESLLDVGFQMSFAAVVALVAAFEAWRRRQREPADAHRWWRTLVRPMLFLTGVVATTLIASAAVAPFGAYHFHKSQQYAVIANLIAIPACNFIVMPAALATLVALPFGLEAGPLRVMGEGIDFMTWTANTVAALPGAVLHLPAIPEAAFALMVVGGLWLTLWRTRWRLFGLALIAAGIGLAPTRQRPDVIVGLEGGLVAVRGADDNLTAVRDRGGKFELTRWLEHDGDGRDADAATGGDGFRCDQRGCTSDVKGVLLAVARHPSALVDDCRRADLLVLDFRTPASCRTESPIIDRTALRREGTHALYIDGARIRIATVRAWRGERPWVLDPTARPRGPNGTPHTATVGRSRLAAFAATVELTDLIGDSAGSLDDAEREDAEAFVSDDAAPDLAE